MGSAALTIRWTGAAERVSFKFNADWRPPGQLCRSPELSHMDIDEFGSSGMLGDIPEAFRKYLGLEPLESIVCAPNARGVTRLLTCPSFEPIEATTLLYLEDKVMASHVISDDDVWERIACGNDFPIDSEVSPALRDLAASDLPPQFRSWELVAESLAGAESCMSDNPNEIPYYHFAYGERVDLSAAWFNPTKAANPRQCAIIEAYLLIKGLL